MHYDPSKHWQLHAQWHSVTSQTTWPSATMPWETQILQCQKHIWKLSSVTPFHGVVFRVCCNARHYVHHFRLPTNLHTALRQLLSTLLTGYKRHVTWHLYVQAVSVLQHTLQLPQPH
jgi:hypothetical protein